MFWNCFLGNYKAHLSAPFSPTNPPRERCLTPITFTLLIFLGMNWFWIALPLALFDFQSYECNAAAHKGNRHLSSTELESGNAPGAFLQTPSPILENSWTHGCKILFSTGLQLGTFIGTAQLLPAPALDKNWSPTSGIMA